MSLNDQCLYLAGIKTEVKWGMDTTPIQKLKNNKTTKNNKMCTQYT